MRQSNPMIEALRIEVKSNPVFRDIMHMLAQRVRTRGRLTVTRLKQAMEEEGFNYSRKQYEEVLRFMGKLGIGQLDISPRGHVKSLNGIKIKLQSIGQAALEQGQTLKVRNMPTRYENIVPLQNEMHQKDFVDEKPAKKVAAKPVVRTEDPYPAFLTVIVGGKLVNIPSDAKITPENLGEFIVKFKAMARNEAEK